MKPLSILFIFMLLINSRSEGQPLKITCIEKEIQNEEGQAPSLIKTCRIKNFKFVSTTYPDGDGRYFYAEHETYIFKNNKYVKTTNSNVFNKDQDKLVAIINKRIREDFQKFTIDSVTKDCFTEMDSIPTYKMNDFEISLEGNEFWFEVHWGLVAACRSVDGTIVGFKLDEIKKYLN